MATVNVIPQRPLGSQGMKSSAQAFGAMGLSAFYSSNAVSEEGGIAVIQKANALGITHVDTSDIYQSTPGGHENEHLVGKAIKGRRDTYQIATKFGVTWDASGMGSSGKKEYVRECVEGSLKRLGIPCIDLYYQHRVDRKTPLEETYGELKKLVSEGKIKYVGISEASPAEIRKAHSICPLTAIQIEYSLWSRDVEESVIPTARELGIGIVAYSPLGRGFLTGQIKSPADLAKDDFRATAQPRMEAGAFEQNYKLVEKVKEIADKKGCTSGQLALAWVHSKGDDIFPIPGTKRIKYLEENAAAFQIKLSKTEQDALESIFHPDQGYGGMGLSSSYSTNMVPEDQALAVIHRAKELGITLMDSSDIYGSPGAHENEYLFGKALKGDASAYQMATKFGIVYTPTEFGVNGKKEYVRSCVEGSLKRLGVECIDLYYQHRVDRSTPLEETFGELKKLVSQGKIKYVGISEASPAEIKKAHSICPLTAIQIEYSLWSRDVEESIIPTARSLGIGIVAYSPLGRGFLTGQIKSPDELAKDDYRTIGQPRWAAGAFEQNVKLVDKVRELADKKTCTPGQLALAWVHSKGDDIFPIPGTKRIQYLEENAGAFHIKLSMAEQEALESIFHPDQVVGGRYDDFIGASSWTAGAKE